MQVKILIAGVYSDFDTNPGKAGAQGLAEGSIVDYPAWYANSLIDDGKAERADGGTVVFEQAIAEDAPSLVKQMEETIELNITSAAKVLADKYDLDLSGVEGSGAGGRIITSDVQKLIED